jgi:hypothetical protein
LRIEERPPIWRVAAVILNKQSRTADRGVVPPAWSLGEVLTTPHRENVPLLGNIHRKNLRIEVNEIGGVYSAYGEGVGVYRVLMGKPEGKSQSGDPGVDGRIILRRIFWKWDVGVWTGLSWLRIETGGGHL